VRPSPSWLRVAAGAPPPAVREALRGQAARPDPPAAAAHAPAAPLLSMGSWRSAAQPPSAAQPQPCSAAEGRGEDDAGRGATAGGSPIGPAEPHAAADLLRARQARLRVLAAVTRGAAGAAPGPAPLQAAASARSPGGAGPCAEPQGGRPFALIVDHALRGEAAAEAAGAAAAAAALGLRPVVMRLDWAGRPPAPGATSEVAREARHALLRRKCADLGVRVLLIAHNRGAAPGRRGRAGACVCALLDAASVCEPPRRAAGLGGDRYWLCAGARARSALPRAELIRPRRCVLQVPQCGSGLRL